MRLAGDSSFGDLDVRALMAVFDVPRSTTSAAAEWAAAVEIHVNEAFDADNPGLLKPVACGS